MIDVLDDIADGTFEGHTSIVLAYNVDPLVYDKLIRRNLAASGVTNQIVFCDATPYAASLDAVDSLSRMGRTYSVTPVRVAGAFHPKAYLRVGRRHGLLILGSGNASLGGLVRNAEVFGRFVFNADKDAGPHPAFAQVFELAKQFGEFAPPAVRAQLSRAERWTPWLSDAPVHDGRVVHIGGLDRIPLIEAIRERTRTAPLRRVIAVSSSFDRDLAGVRALSTLGSDHQTFVAVQPDRLSIDGRAVERLGGAVQWTHFVDPRSSKKKDKQERRDNYVHAKVVLLESATADHLFFGSANVSRPALLTGENIEVLVELPPEPPGTWAARLGLERSLEVDARPALLALRWADEDRDDRKHEQLHLGGVEWSPGEGWIVMAEVSATTRLALGAHRTRAEQQLPLRVRGPYAAFAPAVVPGDGVRFGWLIDASGDALSSPVVVTWPEVARARISGWLGASVERAILGMKHGELLGCVLYEFLDRVPDLGVLAVAQLRQAAGKHAKREPSSADEEREAASFYTDAVASPDEVKQLPLGDRSDLDLLISLVQPLDVATRTNPDDEEDEEDDAGIAEEAERRGLDTNKTADGSERGSSTRVPSAKRIHAAGRRFARRVDRAAGALGDTLHALDGDLAIPPAVIARQIWMTFIAGFVAGRAVETSDDGEQVVVEPDVFAHYVLQCAASLAGDGRGGLLRHIDGAAWNTGDGRALANGLRFFVAACAWAVAWFESNYAERERDWNQEDEPLHAEGIHDSIPLFVFARLLVTMRDRVAAPDFLDAPKRITAWDSVSVDSILDAYSRAYRLSVWLAEADRDPSVAVSSHALALGSAVSLKKSGVAIVLAIDGEFVRVAMLGRPHSPAVRFRTASVIAVELPQVGRVLIAPVPPDLLVD